jgi:hypothetical protein
MLLLNSKTKFSTKFRQYLKNKVYLELVEAKYIGK